MVKSRSRFVAQFLENAMISSGVRTSGAFCGCPHQRNAGLRKTEALEPFFDFDCLDARPPAGTPRGKNPLLQIALVGYTIVCLRRSVGNCQPCKRRAFVTKH